MIDNKSKSPDHESEVDDLLQKKEFGSELRNAREKAGLSISDVAEKLLISTDIIKAIENSQAEALPALTFTQGYIRSYARLFNLPADEVINTYIQMAPNSKQVLTPHSVLPAQKSTNDSFVKVFSFIFMVTGLIVLFFWMDQTDFSLDINKTDVLPAIKTIESNDTQVNTNIVIELSPLPDAQIKEEFIEVTEAQPVQSANEIELVNKQDPDSSSIVISNDKIIITATGESWCEIQDSEGKRLFYQLLGVDEEIQLEGIAPFEVFLGNAPKVRIEINNKIVDFEHLINANSNIANLKIESTSEVISSKHR